MRAPRSLLAGRGRSRRRRHRRGAAFAATLSVGSWHLWAGSQTLTKATVHAHRHDADDRHVRRPGDAEHELRHEHDDARPPERRRSQEWSFVRFDLSSCAIPTTGGADTATLTLFDHDGADREPDAHGDAGARRRGRGTLDVERRRSRSRYGSATTTFTTGTTNNARVEHPP